jgi:LPXTG-motif cell wall-anchored protein
MKNFTIVGVCIALALAMIAFSPYARADSRWDKKTVVTITEPVRIEKTTLLPGKYVFMLVDNPAFRHTVRIMNEEETEVIATFIATPNFRLNPTENTQFELWETPKDMPAGLRAWFYPGDNYGQEFAFEKVEATTQVAQAEIPEALAEQPEILPAPAPVPVPEELTEPVAEPVTEVVAEAEPVMPLPVYEEPFPQAPIPLALPKTASNLPLLGLFGLASLGLGGLLHVIRRLV